MTVKEFKRIVAEWPETHKDGSQAAVWMRTGADRATIVSETMMLHCLYGSPMVSCDIWDDPPKGISQDTNPGG